MLVDGKPSVKSNDRWHHENITSIEGNVIETSDYEWTIYSEKIVRKSITGGWEFTFYLS